MIYDLIIQFTKPSIYVVQNVTNRLKMIWKSDLIIQKKCNVAIAMDGKILLHEWIKNRKQKMNVIHSCRSRLRPLVLVTWLWRGLENWASDVKIRTQKYTCSSHQEPKPWTKVAQMPDWLRLRDSPKNFPSKKSCKSIRFIKIV